MAIWPRNIRARELFASSARTRARASSRLGQRTTRVERIGAAEEHVAGFITIADALVEIGQLVLHGRILGIEFEHALEDASGIVQLVAAHVLVGDDEVLLASVGVEALLGIEFGEALDAVVGAGIELGELLVHGDGFDREAIGRITVADFLEILGCLIDKTNTGVEVTDGVEHRQVLGVRLDDLLVLGDRVLQLALLHVTLGVRQYLVLIKTKT